MYLITYTRKVCQLQGDILEDIALIENLEETKRTAVDIAEKVKQAKETELSIGKAREVYRPVATRGSLVYFLIDTLNALDRCYHYSMANFVYILRKGECFDCAVPLHEHIIRALCCNAQMLSALSSIVFTVCKSSFKKQVSSRSAP